MYRGLSDELILSIDTIPGWLTQREGMLLYNLATYKSNSRIFVEIGSYMGKSTTYLALGVKHSRGKAKIFAIDPHKGKTHMDKKTVEPSRREFESNMKRFKVDTFVEPIVKTSQNAHEGWKEKISLLFIDGLHEYSCVKKDIRLWIPHLENERIVIFHDAFSPYPDVFKAVREDIFNSREFYYINYADSAIFAIKGTSKNLREVLLASWTKKIMILSWYVWQVKILPEWVRFKVVNRLKMIIPKIHLGETNSFSNAN